MSEKVDHEFVEWLNWMQEPTGPFRDLCADCGLHRSAHPQPNAQPTGRVTAVLYPGGEKVEVVAAQPAQPPAPEIEPGKYRCKICGTPWLCHTDGTWSIRTTRLAERCCDNHPGFLLVMEKESE